jgi:AcrR family transcriptional regulator
LSEERTEHILGTVLEVLHDVGYDQLRMQNVAERACVGLSTIYRRWPTKQELVRASLCCDRAAQKYAVTGDPRADVEAFLRRLAEDLRGDGAQTMLGFLASLRSDPEIAEVYRTTVLSRMHEHLKTLLAAELGDDFPELDLRATAGPAILFYTAAVCGQPLDAEAMASRLTELLFAPLPGEAHRRTG